MVSSWDEKSVFLAALELAPEQRKEYLARACPDDALRDRIAALLAHHDAVTREILNALPRGDLSKDVQIPSRIEEFQIIRKLGEGGMGVVYLAEDLILGRRVALKVLAPALTESESALARFRAEARSTAAIKHPGIVPVFRFGTDGKVHYIASEYVDGPTLAEAIEAERGRRSKPIDAATLRDWFRRAAGITKHVAEALEAAHCQQILHRDVKPSNILLEGGERPRLTDFGIAKFLTQEAREVGTLAIGTCHYMSPEQASVAQASIDQRSDVFSLGVVLHELITLRRPFEGNTQAEILRALAEKETPRLRQIDPRFPRDLEVICQKAMEKRPVDRYQTAGHLSADLRCFLEARPILAIPPSRVRRLRHWLSRRKVLALATTSVILLAALIVFAMFVHWSKAESLAWVHVVGDIPGATVSVQRVDSDTHELDPRALDLGLVPVRRPLALGHYRITSRAPNPERFAEFNVVLHQPGRDACLTLHVCADGLSAPPVLPSTPNRVLYGYLASSQAMPPPGMLLIRGGSYSVGWSNAREGALVRQRIVNLAPFFIDRTEVSNADYYAFTQATGHPWPDHWKEFGYDPALDQYPIFNMTLEDAEAFARWRGCRLPTALEWQAAARGTLGYRYPWGDEWARSPGFEPVRDEDRRILASSDLAQLYRLHCDRLVPVAAPDSAATPTGLLQVFGNVRELTGSITFPTRSVVTLGRGWHEEAEGSHLGYTEEFPRDRHSFRYGFRCAKSAESRR